MEGGTTFHFIDASPAEALETAREAADGQDVRLGGGPTMIREFLATGLVDHMHIVVVPILLGRGVRLWDGLEGLEKDYEIESTSSPSGVTHVTFTRAGELSVEAKGTTMPELLIDFITSLDGYGAADGWPGWWGLEGPEYLAWLGEAPEATTRS